MNCSRASHNITGHQPITYNRVPNVSSSSTQLTTRVLVIAQLIGASISLTCISCLSISARLLHRYALNSLQLVSHAQPCHEDPTIFQPTPPFHYSRHLTCAASR